MKLVITFVAGAALFLAPLPAQAESAAKNPVSALKAQLKAGKGVRFTDASAFVGSINKDPLVRRKGVVQFGKKGIVASDVRGTFASPLFEGHTTKPERTIIIGKDAWRSGGSLAERLPKGKTWYKTFSLFNMGTVSSLFGQVVSPLEPATLAELVKRSKRSGSSYTGTITFERLSNISPWFRETIGLTRSTEATVAYTLTVDRKGLPSKLKTSWVATDLAAIPSWEEKTVVTETRYTGWGAKVSIKQPPKSQVTSKLED
ncbi:hypothetical protein AB0K05_44275 [Nonomuraea sp. NPDC049486]|uniref:hypothetical protein n=1 Tax=Nonomuraea sp. NPDC049486 TaxID=3155773 RepID=UPI0034241C0D